MTTCATSGTAQATRTGGNKAGSGAAIKGLFGAAKAVLCGKDEDEPEPRRKRGETEGEFRRTARYLWRRFDVRQGFKLWSGITSRYVQPDPAAYAVASEYLASALDALNQMNDGTGAITATITMWYRILIRFTFNPWEICMTTIPKNHTHTVYAYQRTGKKHGRMLECGSGRIDPVQNGAHVIMDRQPLGGYTGYILLLPFGVKPTPQATQPEQIEESDGDHAEG